MKKSNDVYNNVISNFKRMCNNLKFKTPVCSQNHNYRHEFKLLVNPYTAQKYIALCSRYMSYDEHCNNSGNYYIGSLYLDTPSDMDYYNKELGAYDRKKIRIRSYGHDLEWANLEMKRKIDVWEYKDYVRITRQQVYMISEGDYSCLLKLNNDDAVRFYAILAGGMYKPSNIIEYNRTAFMLGFENIRITFDSDIKFTISSSDLFNPGIMTNVFKEGYSVIEIKYDEYLPSWIKRMMKDIRQNEESVSKYCSAKDIIM